MSGRGDTFRPRIGIPHLLIYRECMCGEWCATSEGAKAPICPVCGLRMMPLGVAELEDGRPQFGRDLKEQRQLRALGFMALLGNEQAMVQSLTQVSRFLGLYQADTHAPYGHGPGRYAAGDGREIELALLARGLPTRVPDIVKRALGIDTAEVLS